MTAYNNLFKKLNNIKPKTGDILISEPFLQEAYFHQSVVLLLEHKQYGSTGIVLNKKTNLFLNTFIKEFEFLPNIPIYIGGPVNTSTLYYIHTFENVQTPNCININDELFFDGDFEKIKQIVLQDPSVIDRKIKFFLGYSGWSKNQLLNELNNKNWALGKIDKNDIFESNPNLWRSSLKKLNNQYKKWSYMPSDPSLN